MSTGDDNFIKVTVCKSCTKTQSNIQNLEQQISNTEQPIKATCKKCQGNLQNIDALNMKILKLDIIISTGRCVECVRVEKSIKFLKPEVKENRKLIQKPRYNNHTYDDLSRKNDYLTKEYEKTLKGHEKITANIKDCTFNIQENHTRIEDENKQIRSRCALFENDIEEMQNTVKELKRTIMTLKYEKLNVKEIYDRFKTYEEKMSSSWDSNWLFYEQSADKHESIDNGVRQTQMEWNPHKEVFNWRDVETNDLQLNDKETEYFRQYENKFIKRKSIVVPKASDSTIDDGQNGESAATHAIEEILHNNMNASDVSTESVHSESSENYEPVLTKEEVTVSENVIITE